MYSTYLYIPHITYLGTMVWKYTIFDYVGFLGFRLLYYFEYEFMLYFLKIRIVCQASLNLRSIYFLV